MNAFDCDIPAMEVWPNDADATYRIKWEDLKKPPSPTHVLGFSEYNCTSSTKSSSPSSFPTFSFDSTPPKSRGSSRSRSKMPSKSSGGQSSVLEEFCNHKGSFEDLSEIKGHFLEFSTAKHGSYFIQQHMETATDGEKQEIFTELLPSASFLMTDPFGNYVIQKFFEFGSPHQVQILCSLLRGNVVTLSFQMFGCRVVQKAIESLAGDDQVKVIEELDGHVIDCARDQNGNHVIQKCLECVSPVKLDFIMKSFEGMVVPLATHYYGCRVVQRVLENATATQCWRLVREVLPNTYHLVQIPFRLSRYQATRPGSILQDQHGNYVMQHILEHGEMADRSVIIQKLRGQLTTLSQHKFASNVIEKCISHSPSEVLRYQIIEELMLQEDTLLVLLKDQYGNYVMQKALDCAASDQGTSLVYKIRPHLPTLRKYTYAKRVVSKVEKIIMTRKFW